MLSSNSNEYQYLKADFLHNCFDSILQVGQALKVLKYL